MSATSRRPMKPAPPPVVTPRVAPELYENDCLIELEELRKFKLRLEWLGNPLNKFSYSIVADGSVKVFRNARDFETFPSLAAAVDSRMAGHYPKDETGFYR